MKNIQNQLFWITILFFILGIINISLAVFGALCFIIPFLQYVKYHDQVWCKFYCPRAGFFSQVIKRINIGLQPPKFFTKAWFKEGVVMYFTVNLLLVIMTSIMVGIGRIAPITQVRFLLVFVLPFDLPQVVDFVLHPVITHLGYRLFSMMLTSVTIGSLLGIVYRPRTWCSFCPVSTLTKVQKPKLIKEE